MSLGLIHGSKHIHLWSKSVDGSEFANAIYVDETDAALAFCAIAVQLKRNDPEEHKIKIEDVMLSLRNGRGMYVGHPGLVLVLSRCSGGCMSPVWN